TNEDVEISSQDIEGWLVANANGITVALDITLTDELKKEGISRELVNRIQNIRKDSGFEVTDKIKIKMLQTAVVEEAVKASIDDMQDSTEIECEDIETKNNVAK